ncbi:MAG: hypothetical protein QOE90_2838 [Thermoplasmata archaeon]|jgi:hypothetical protein|nr:hypothetical protein [Thermoplasmata archaeon]
MRVRRGFLLLLILLLPGCARPGDAPASALAAPACSLTGRGDVPAGPDCALEWLNVTLTPAGPERYHAALPAPAFGLRRLLGDWAANATIEGDGTLLAEDFGEGPVLLVNASGPVTLRATRTTSPDPETLTAESYLFARWTTSPADLRPHALRVMVDANPAPPTSVVVNLTYDAMSRACGRHAAFSGAVPSGGWTPIAGADEATCS